MLMDLAVGAFALWQHNTVFCSHGIPQTGVPYRRCEELASTSAALVPPPSDAGVGDCWTARGSSRRDQICPPYTAVPLAVSHEGGTQPLSRDWAAECQDPTDRTLPSGSCPFRDQT